MAEHDQLFKRVFRRPEHAAAAPAAVLPPALLGAVDLDSLEAVPGDIVDERLRERFADALFRANFHGTLGYVYLLLEHQSEPHRWMPLRVLRHIVRLWGELADAHPQRATLPPILCVVVHHGEQGWSEARSMHELVDGVAEIEGLARLVPNFELVIDDLAGQSDAALRARPLASFAKLALWALRDGRTIDRLLEHASAWADEPDRLGRESQEDATTLLRYILLVAGDSSYEQVRQHIVQVAPTTEVAMTSAGQRLIEEGIRRGEATGKATGKAEGKADDVLAVLGARGVAVPDEARERVLACRDIAVLDRWIVRAVTARSVEELFAAPFPPPPARPQSGGGSL